MTIEIKRATAKDFRLVLDIAKEFYGWVCDHDKYSKPSWKERGLPVSVGKAIRDRKKQYFLAFDDDKLIGYSFAEIKKSPKFIKYEREGYYHALYIRKDNRGKGAGLKLLEAMSVFFKENDVKYQNILVHSFNKNAAQIYRRFGFKDHLLDLRMIKE